MRVLRTKFFLGSTTEEIEKAQETWLINNEICPGNYIEHQLYKLGDVYQAVLIYAQFISKEEE